MPSRTFPGLSLRGGYTQGEGGWGAAMTEDLRKLSAVAQLTVKSRTTTLPGTGTAGDVYIVPSGAGSNANEVAVWDDGAWAYIAPDEGWRGYVQDDNESVVYTGTGWSADTPSGSALVSSLNAQLGGSSWQSPLTATDIVSALDAEFGGPRGPKRLPPI